MVAFHNGSRGATGDRALKLGKSPFESEGERRLQK
jgi:hypothetical protein